MVIVDDHAVLRAGLEQLLAGEPDLEVVGKAADGARRRSTWCASSAPTSC